MRRSNRAPLPLRPASANSRPSISAVHLGSIVQGAAVFSFPDSPGLTRHVFCNIISYMKFDARLSGALHLLLHMAEFDGPVTSATLAQVMRTNPVVVRRMMAGLRRYGYVQSERGHGGGWVLSCDLETTTLLDIYRALGSPTLIGMGLGEPGATCLVERAVESSLADARREAEHVLLDRFAEITLASLSTDFHRKWAARSATYMEDVHGI